jgi:hypothetical protein
MLRLVVRHCGFQDLHKVLQGRVSDCKPLGYWCFDEVYMLLKAMPTGDREIKSIVESLRCCNSLGNLDFSAFVVRHHHPVQFPTNQTLLEIARDYVTTRSQSG